jgi:hypothetical protein
VGTLNSEPLTTINPKVARSRCRIMIASTPGFTVYAVAAFA